MSLRFLIALPLVAVAIAACDRAGSKGASVGQFGTPLVDTVPLNYSYAPPQPVGSYPTSYARIQSWINSASTDSIRAHGWNIWASITATTPEGLPTWQTWFSGYELFSDTSAVGVTARPRNGIVQFGIARKLIHPSTISRPADGKMPEDRAERVFAFNRYSQSTAEFIWRNRLNEGNTLRDTGLAFSKRRTPLANRAILVSKDSTDSMSFVLKPVYQFISDTGVTAVPYWAGDSSAVTTDSANPIAKTWKQGVAVSPSGKVKPGDSVFMSVNDQPKRWIKVVPLSAFYHVRITRDDSIHFSQFGAESGDFIGASNDTAQDSVVAAVRPGNYGLLMAMHVTGKEIPNWTWQSFWWALNPQDPQFGADRPKDIPAPWNHYNMTVAYSMTTNGMPDGQPLVAYNPYLETSLNGWIPKTPGPPRDSVFWTGVSSNCMSCHRRAAIGYYGPSAMSPPYGPAMQVNPGDTVIFMQRRKGAPAPVPLVMTDFMWSIVVRVSPVTVAPITPIRR
ncbi:MAG TPA: hypothetical protein VLN49_05525 [Gemmatimonadaceae bacterium]|nr:hypothetical protein [Gemmatimonadaceae bacterium]